MTAPFSSSARLGRAAARGTTAGGPGLRERGSRRDRRCHEAGAHCRRRDRAHARASLASQLRKRRRGLGFPPGAPPRGQHGYLSRKASSVAGGKQPRHYRLIGSTDMASPAYTAIRPSRQQVYGPQIALLVCGVGSSARWARVPRSLCPAKHSRRTSLHACRCAPTALHTESVASAQGLGTVAAKMPLRSWVR